MKLHTCHDCHQPVRRSDAHLRSIAFEPVAFCRPCWALRSAVDEVFADPAVVIAAHVGSAA